MHSSSVVGINNLPIITIILFRWYPIADLDHNQLSPEPVRKKHKQKACQLKIKERY